MNNKYQTNKEKRMRNKEQYANILKYVSSFLILLLLTQEKTFFVEVLTQLLSLVVSALLAILDLI